MLSESELANSTIGVQAQRLVKPVIRVTPQRGGEVSLIRFSDIARGTKEYGTIVLGRELNTKPGERFGRAQDALDAAMDELPKIKAEEASQKAAVLAEIEAKFKVSEPVSYKQDGTISSINPDGSVNLEYAQEQARSIDYALANGGSEPE